MTCFPSMYISYQCRQLHQEEIEACIYCSFGMDWIYSIKQGQEFQTYKTRVDDIRVIHQIEQRIITYNNKSVHGEIIMIGNL